MQSGVLTQPGIDIHALTLRYGARTVFHDLTLHIPAGGFTVLLGASGAGKTSLLRILAGLGKPSAGQIRATDGQSLSGRVGYMAQTDLLYPWLSALDNVMLGARLRGTARDRPRAMDLLARVGLQDRAAARPGVLSGGMRQRVALARALYEDRPIVLMDEPFSGLDTVTRARVQDLAAAVLAGRTVVMVTHDPLEACRLGDTLFVMAGQPSSLGQALHVPGQAPRAPDDIGLLETQGRLMRALMAT